MAAKDSFQEVRGPRRRRIVLRQLALVVAVAVVAVVAIVLARDHGSSGNTSSIADLPAATDNAAGPASHVSFLERLIPAPAETTPSGPSAPSSLADLARRLPLDRAVAQLFLLGFN